METRKVQLSGGTTYTVSLPKAWAREHGIEAGSVLRMHPSDDGSLLVEAAGDRETTAREATLDVAGDDESVRRQVEAAYLTGVDSVTLTDRSRRMDEHRPAVADAVRGLSGFEILDTTESRLRLTNLIDAENVDVRKSALRLRLVMLAMHRDAITALVENDADLAEQVIRRDDEADKLFAMVTRHFRRALGDLHEVEKLAWSRDELFEYYYAARQFERVADHAEKLAGFALEPDADVSADERYTEKVTRLGSACRDVVDDAADVVFTDSDAAAAFAVFREHDRVMDDLEALDRELYDHDDPAEAYVFGLVLDSLRRTVEYGANVAEIGLQQRVRAAVGD